MNAEELSDIRTQLKILEARKCPEGDCPLLYPGCGCGRSKMLEHIDSQASQIAVLKATLLAEKTRFGLGRKRVVLAELAQEFPAIFGEDVNE
jgi:hypothetical protein